MHANNAAVGRDSIALIVFLLDSASVRRLVDLTQNEALILISSLQRRRRVMTDPITGTSDDAMS